MDNAKVIISSGGDDSETVSFEDLEGLEDKTPMPLVITKATVGRGLARSSPASGDTPRPRVADLELVVQGRKRARELEREEAERLEKEEAERKKKAAKNAKKDATGAEKKDKKKKKSKPKKDKDKTKDKKKKKDSSKKSKKTKGKSKKGKKNQRSSSDSEGEEATEWVYVL